MAKHIWSPVCLAERFEALKLGDVIPGPGKNKHTNFLLYLVNLEELESKPKAQLLQELKELDRNKT